MNRKILTTREKHERSHFDNMSLKYDQNYGYNDGFTQYKLQKKSNFFNQLTTNLLTRQKSLQILELGVGTGEYTKLIATNKKLHFTCIDISDGILSVAKDKLKKYKNVELLCRSAYNTGLPSQSVDVVCGFYILHHLNLDLVRDEMIRVLKPGGIIYFYEPNMANPVVYMIKNTPFLKKMVGDSPDETAINPYTITSQFAPLKKISIRTSEFIPPLNFLNLKKAIVIDEFSTKLFGAIPWIKYLGGSVELIFTNTI